jgi:hypothetical protein
MKVLVCWPPHVPSYFNAGHHLPVFSIAAFLRARGYEVDALDAGALNCTWKDFADKVFQGGYDLVVLVNDFDVVEGVRRAAEYTRALAPSAVLMTVGRLSYQNPGFFRELDLDVVAESGDYEAAVVETLRWMTDGRPAEADLAGVSWRTGQDWHAPVRPGTWMPADDWVLPQVEEIPYAHYEMLYGRDQNKFCGIPERRELVVPVARGCPVGCDFCDVPPMQGLRERRMGVERVVSYIRDSFADHPFEYVAFYAPTFTLSKRWVRQLCEALSAEPRQYPWKCATTMFHLDEELVRAMGEAGCVRISVGVETFETDGEAGLPTVKKSARERFDELARWCSDSGVELNCFLIIGLPGTTPEGARRAMDVISAAGARVRPTLYTPYNLMREDMTEREMSAFNRQLFVDENEIRRGGREPSEYLAVLYGGDDYVTPATGRVDQVAGRVSPLPAAGW